MMSTRDLPEQLHPSSGATKHFADVLERVSDGLVALDRRWCYTYVNSQAASLFGRRPEDLIGRHIWTEFPEGVGQPFHLAYERAMAEQIFIQVESCYEPWNRWFENRIFPSPDGLSIFFHEITQRKRAEQEAQASTRLLRGQNDVLELIASGTPLHQTLDLLLRVIEAQCAGDQMLSSILLLEQDGERMSHGAAPSLPAGYVRAIDGQRMGPSAGSCGTAAYRGEPVIVADIATDPLWDGYREVALSHGLRACWSTPIFDAQRHVLGTFALYFRNPGGPTDRHRQLIDICTHTAAIAIVKHRETQALRAGEERLRLAVTAGNVGTWEWNIRNDRVVSASPWQAAPVEFGSLQAALATIHAGDRDRVAAAIRDAVDHRSRLDTEYRTTAPDGSAHWIAATGRPEYDIADNPVRMVGVVLDITDRKRAEEETARRQAQLADAQRIARLGSYHWDVATNRVDRSEELYRIFGLSSDEFESTFDGYLARVHADDRAATQRAIETAFAARSPFSFEERIVRPDGSVRWLHSQGRWICDDANLPVTLVGICQDITERKQVEDQLRRSDERFQIVARATNDAIWDWDISTDSLWWNQGITTLFGYPAVEVRPQASWRSDRIHPDDSARVTAELRAVMETRAQVWSGEYRFRRADGSYAETYDRGYVMYDSSMQPARMLGAMSDISERKRAVEILEDRVAARTVELLAKNQQLEEEVGRRGRAEQLLRARNDELKAFAYTVSHDLKAPLRGIAGYAQELDRRHRAGLGDRALLCITHILTATRSLDRLIEDLLYYSRVDAESTTETAVSLDRLVAAILHDRKLAILEQRADVSVALGRKSVYAWERGLNQIMTNLIDNALKYSRAAQPPRLRVLSEEHEGVVRITVADNGIGFDMKYHQRIFGLFNRLVRQEEFEGTGAGLAIARKLADKMRGRIWAESAPGAGAAFHLELPLTPDRAAEE
jgi:PAS domain S-box-containing protein